MASFYLDPETWDLVVDANGNIAMCDQQYEVVQNVCCATRLWRGEDIFRPLRGIPYDVDVLGNSVIAANLDTIYKAEAEQVTGVSSVETQLYFESQTRKITGSLLVTLTDGTVINV